MRIFHYNLKIVVGLAVVVLIGLVFWFKSPEQIIKLEPPVIKFEAQRSSEPQVALGSLPDIVIVDEEGIKSLSYNARTQQYDVKKSLVMEDALLVSIAKEDIFAGTTKGILRLNKNFEKTHTGLSDSAIAALEIFGDYVFATADGKFYALDKDLNKLGEVTLLEQGFKDAHDILLYKNFAYLLDNVVNPIYLYKVDIGNLRQPKVLKEIELFGINYHLQNQWLDPEKNRWMIVGDSTTMTGQYQELLAYNSETGKEEDIDSNYFKKWDDYPDKVEIEPFGTKILAALKSRPIWAVGEKLDQKYYVFEIRLGKDKPEFTNIIDLKLGVDSSLAHANIQKAGNYLIITLDKTLIVVDLEKKRVVLSQTLSSQVSDMTLISRK